MSVEKAFLLPQADGRALLCSQLFVCLSINAIQPIMQIDSFCNFLSVTFDKNNRSYFRRNNFRLWLPFAIPNKYTSKIEPITLKSTAI